MTNITITAGDVSLDAELNDTDTAQRIADILPIEGTANVWGEEIYFDIPLKLELAADARAEMKVGALAYWPTGSAFCIFFGPTPVSTGEQPMAYSPVNAFGKITGDCDALKTVPDGAIVRVERR